MARVLASTALFTAARGARFGRPLPLLLASAATARASIDYDALAGLPQSFAREAGEYARAGATPEKSRDGFDIATFAAGCFWGVELEFQRVPGVVATCSGYVMGRVDAPTYEDVSGGRSGHTEAVQLIYDPGVVSYDDLLAKFWARLGDDAFAHHRVGNDRGPQYRSGIYASSAAQLDAARRSLVARQAERPDARVHTEVEAIRGVFWPAEEYHQQYLEKGGRFGRPQSAAKGDTTPIRCYG